MESVRPRHGRREAVLVAAAMAVLYLLTLTSNHTEADDAVSYAVGVREGDTEAAILHAHHILWGAIGWVAHNAALALGFSGGALEVLQVQNALSGAIGIGLLWGWLRSIGWSRHACVAACGILAFSYGYWFYSSETEVYVLSALLLICCLVAAYRAVAEPSVKRFAVLGAVNALAVLGHDTNVLFAGVAVAALLLSRRGAPPSELLRRGGAYAAVAVAIVVPVYTAAALVNGHDSPRSAYDWITGYTHSSEWGESRLSQVPKGAAGGARSLVGGHFVFSTDTLADRLERLGGRNPREERFLMRDFPTGLAFVLLAVAGAVAAGVLALAVGGVRARGRLDESARTVGVLCLTWAIVYGVFAIWWDPLNVEFWIPVWIPLAILLALPLASGPDAAPRGARRLALLVVGLLFVVNLAGSVIPQMSTEDDYWRARIAWYEREAAPDDLVVANNYHQTAYIGYFANRTALDAARVDAEVGGDPAALVRAIRADIAGFGSDRVFVSREAFDPGGDAFSNCEGGEQCRIAAVLRPAFEPGSRVVHRDELETVWQLRGHAAAP